MNHFFFKTFLVFILAVNVSVLHGQCPTDTIFLTTQQDIDNFSTQFPNCTIIDQDVVIEGSYQIRNLNGLSYITGITGFLDIRSCKTIDDLTGLDNLTSVGGFLRIAGNDINSLRGLENLESIGGDLYIQNNDYLENINALSAITHLNGITLRNNSALASLNGLENVTTISNNFILENSASLTTLYGLQNLASVGARLLILRNDQLSNLAGLGSLSSVGSLDITENQSLMGLTGLESLREVNGKFHIGANRNLVDIAALSNLYTIGGSLWITNTRIQNLDVFQNINAINGILNISNNSELVNIEGVRNIDASTITLLFIQSNPHLSQCAIESVCDFLALNTENAYISLNASGCENRQEVETACLLNIEDHQLSEVKIYPNPTANCFEISGLNEGIIRILDYQGRTVKQMVINENSYSISELSSGIYFVIITSDNSSVIERLVKI